MRRNPTELTSRLMVKDLESGIETTLAEDISRDMQETSGDRGNYPGFAWMPDGESLVLWSQGNCRKLGLDGSGIESNSACATSAGPARRCARTEVGAGTGRGQHAALEPCLAGRQVAVYQALGYIWIHDLESASAGA